MSSTAASALARARCGRNTPSTAPFNDEHYGRLVSGAGWNREDHVATMTRIMSAALLRDT